jgi:hypothetical protein
VILKMVPLAPGDVLDHRALRAAEKNLAALHAAISVIESGGGSDFKDVRVTVTEGKQAGTEGGNRGPDK